MEYKGPLELVQLDSRGNTRVAECLSNGTTLAHRLASSLPLADGTVFAVVASDIPADHLYEFDRVGAIPQLPREQWIHNSDGTAVQEVVTARGIFAPAVAARLRELHGTLVVQDYYHIPSDPHVVRRGHQPWLLGPELYYVSRSDGEDEVADLLGMDDIWPGLTALVTEVDLPSALRASEHEIEPPLLDRLVAGARELVIGVYDAESCLLWTRDAHVAESYRSAMTPR